MPEIKQRPVEADRLDADLAEIADLEPVARPELSEDFEHLRWFPLPEEIAQAHPSPQ